eukprot:gene1795-2001_t
MKNLPAKVLQPIVPCVTYCVAVWGTCPISSFNRLEVLHIKAAKIIYKLPPETPDLEVLNTVKWKPLSYIYKRRTASIMFQVNNNSLPQQLTNLFLKQNDTANNRHNLRKKKDFVHIRPNNEYGRNSLRYRGPIVWNALPVDIRKAVTRENFKAKLRRISNTIESIQFEKETVVLTYKNQDFIYF